MNGRVLVLLGMCACLGLLIALWGSGPSPQVGPSSRGAVSSARVAVQRADSDVGAAIREQATASEAVGRVIRVVDESTRAAIPLARIIRLASAVDRLGANVLGEWFSDDSGSAVLPLTSDIAPSGWRVSAVGYIASTGAGDPPGEVALKAGAAIEVMLRDVAGLPVADVLCIAYRQQAPSLAASATDLAAMVPGPNVERAVYVDRTGEGGTARLAGMPPGRYGIGIVEIDHVLLGLSPDEVELGEVDSRAHGIIGHALCCVVGSASQDVVAVRLLAVHGSEVEPRSPAGIGAIRRRLERSFPGAHAVVCCVPRQTIGLSARLAVTLAGWRTVEVDLPLTPPSRAQPVAVSGVEAHPSGLLRVFLRTPSGVDLRGLEVSLAAKDKAGDPLFVGMPIESGRQYRVPVGSYTASAWDPLFQAGPEVFSVAREKESVAFIPCQKELRSLRLRILAAGSVPRFATLQLAGEGWQSSEFLTYEPGACTCAGMAGPAVLSVRVYGHQPFEQAITISDDPGIQDIEVLVP